MANITRPIRDLQQLSPYVPHVQLLGFINAVSVAQPTWKVWVESGTVAWVYREEDELAMGAIELRSGAYAVRSRLITNRRYADHNRLYHMKASKSLATAVKTATEYLQPHTLPEMTRYYGPRYSEAVSAVQNKERTEYNKLDTMLFGGGYNRPESLLAELKHMLDTGYQFLNLETKATVTAYLKARADNKQRERDRPTSTAFVHISPSSSEPVVTVALYTNVFPYSHVPPMDGGSFPLSTLPEHLADKLAVLNMVDIGHYVEGVGQRASDRSFYVSID